jgi:hypothetical protein
MISAELPVEQRILQLFEHLGISQAHLASRMPQDWKGFVTTYPERVASLTLVCPSGVDPRALQPRFSAAGDSRRSGSTGGTCAPTLDAADGSDNPHPA